MADPANTPVEIRSPRGAESSQILYDDGHLGEYPHEILRGFCPCAGCQGHSGGISFQAGGDAALEDIEEVGGYGLKLTWGDGHNTGIYSFAYLRRLCGCSACRSGDPRTRHFGR